MSVVCARSYKASNGFAGEFFPWRRYKIYMYLGCPSSQLAFAACLLAHNQLLLFIICRFLHGLQATFERLIYFLHFLQNRPSRFPGFIVYPWPVSYPGCSYIAQGRSGGEAMWRAIRLYVLKVPLITVL